MKRLHKIALSVVALVAVGIGFGGCADESKSPLMEIKTSSTLDATAIHLYSQDDETIIKKMTIKGRNGKCDIKNLGAGGKWQFLFVSLPLVKYGEKLPYETKRAAIFDNEICPPKNGKYEVEIDTNFGTYYYEAKAVIGESFL